ncbi:MAG: STAS domain-containing protein [Chloroflexota bacterium]|nr:STAS domain-containing protein [Chloroflexota bacterium]
MNLTVVNVTENGVMVVAIEGRVDSSNAQKFERVLKAVADAGTNGIVLDLESLLYISSAALRVLLGLTKAQARKGGTLTVCAVPDSLRRILEVSGFDQIIPVHDSQAEALAACSR